MQKLWLWARRKGLSLPPALLAIAGPLYAMLKKPTHKQHIWFLPTQKPTLEKPKELFFANARQKMNEKRKT